MSNAHWQNWAGNLHLDLVPERPASRAELVSAVQRASHAEKQIRVVGGGHSWSPLVGNEELYPGKPGGAKNLVLIDMSRIKRVLGPVVDTGSGAPTVKVECGITIGELEVALQNQESGKRYCLISPTLFPRPTIGGVISTGSHGTGRNSGCFADSVCELEFITDGGHTRVIAENQPGFEAARVCLGSFGVLYSATLRVQENPRVYTDRRVVPFHHTFRQFEDLSVSAEYLEIFYWPFQNRLWVFVMNGTESFPDKPNCWNQLTEKVGDWMQDTLGGKFLPWIASRRPGLTPVMCKISSRLINRVDASVKYASDAFHFQKAYPKAWDMSYAVPIAATQEAWGRAIALIDQYADSKIYPVNLVLHCRFIQKGDGWLALNEGEDMCIIEVATSLGTPDHLWKEFFDTLESHWFGIDRSRPHWAKLSNKIEQVGARYSKMSQFLAERHSWDPKGRFLNPYLEKLFFPSGPYFLPPPKPWRPFEIKLF